MSQTKRGEMVVIQAFGGKPLIKRVWEVTSRLVYICSDRQLELLNSGREAPPPIGFPVNDVYRYDQKAEREMASGGIVDWSSLERVA